MKPTDFVKMHGSGNAVGARYSTHTEFSEQCFVVLVMASSVLAWSTLKDFLHGRGRQRCPEACSKQDQTS